MATYVKYQDFTEQLCKAVHDLDGTHTLKIALTNTAITATDTGLSNITEISAGNGYTAGGETVASVTLSETSGTAKLVLGDEVFTASGGAIGPFQYAVLYNDSATTPADALIASWDYGSSISLADTETLTVDFDPTNGVFQLV